MSPPALQSGGRVSAIVPQSMEDAYRLGKAVCVAGMAPKGMDTPEKCMIAIMQGMEVGLTPMQSLQRIAVVNGRPTIWGDGAMALVRASGLCEYVRETVRGEGDARVAGCVVKRRNEPDEVTRTFSVADAKKAGLWGKQGPWQQYPERMLQMRARAFALRDVFADVLGGLYVREEVDDGRAEPVSGPTPPSPPSAERTTIATQPPSPTITSEQPQTDVNDQVNATQFFEDLELALAGAKSIEDVEEAWNEFDPGGTFDGDDDSLTIAQKIKDRRLRDFQ
ncbi:recombinase RecT [Aureimonas fodinaquatilis]|uniref:Recombinase RecT n=2 Tax=Aureimonas fodinaquatilis TaxID=2565783 RepID=A0A5B0DXR2_9HYPH|nr:recombinase RecT [Aureimonas fodinaquatilis]